MRLRFEQQLKLGIVPISEVKLNIKSRHGLVPVLRALQYAFKTQELNEQIFELLEQEVKSGLQETGRYGMSLWEILVLGVVRLTEN
ncbi:MAG: ISNCY family transposase, partial [Bacteroidota bacterium]